MICMEASRPYLSLQILAGIGASIFLCCCRTEEGELLKDINKAELTALRAEYANSGALATAILQVKRSQDPVQRNDLLNDLIRVVDLNYYHQEKLLYDKKAYTDFLSDTAVLGLSAAGTFSLASETSQILHAISGGITGVRSAFDSNVLQKQGMAAIIAKMRALRAERMKFLRSGMMKKICDADACKKWHYQPREIEQYSVSQGLNDLIAYYYAGTFVGAIEGIQTDAGVQKKKAEEESPSAPTPAPSPKT
jgi:hypothetical protein